MPVEIRIARPEETSAVAEVLAEAAAWLDASGAPMWKMDELRPELVAREVEAGLFAVAWSDGEAAGVMKFQIEDPLFWPDHPEGVAAYIHRLAVRRRFSGGGLSTALMSWAVAETRRRGRRVLRLDCEIDRASLRAVYERFGFRHHSDRTVGPYVVARYEYAIE